MVVCGHRCWARTLNSRSQACTLQQTHRGCRICSPRAHSSRCGWSWCRSCRCRCSSVRRRSPCCRVRSRPVRQACRCCRRTCCLPRGSSVRCKTLPLPHLSKVHSARIPSALHFRRVPAVAADHGPHAGPQKQMACRGSRRTHSSGSCPSRSPRGSGPGSISRRRSRRRFQETRTRCSEDLSQRSMAIIVG